jgi:hypothetical protein
VHEGKLWLEPSDHFTSREEAVRTGQARNQIAIFDLNSFEEIPTGGSGGGKITEHSASGATARVYQEGASGGTSELSGAAGGSAACRSWEAGHSHPGLAEQILELTRQGTLSP